VVLTTGDTSATIRELAHDPNLRIMRKPFAAEDLLASRQKTMLAAQRSMRDRLAPVQNSCHASSPPSAATAAGAGRPGRIASFRANVIDELLCSTGYTGRRARLSLPEI